MGASGARQSSSHRGRREVRIVLSYTGHALVDIGVATICAFVDKSDPAALTEGDLDSVARYVADNYPLDPLKSFLTVAFTTNSDYSQPAFDRQPEKRRERVERIVGAWRQGSHAPGVACAYTGAPAALRADRRHVPLLAGEDQINFYPYGEAGLPVSGFALLALQAFPLGCAKVAGRLLAVHADDPRLTYRFARRFLTANRQAIFTAQQLGERKLPEPAQRITTLLVDNLLAIEEERREALEEQGPVSVTAYHLSNSGQGVALDIYHLPLEVMDFIRQALTPRHRDQWQALCARGWQIINAGRRGRGRDAERPQFNVLYDDLLRLPDDAVSFIRRYFLRRADRTRQPGDPRATYSLMGEAELVSFGLTELFLRTVVGMDQQRIQAIRALGDTLAEYVAGENDRSFFHSFMRAQRPDHLRATLIRASWARVKRGAPPLVTFDPYIEVFEEGEDLPRADWKLARDLVLIRMVERLYDLGWVQAHAAELPEAPADEAETA